MIKTIIAISGKSGCGNTSVSEKLSKKIKFKHVNYTFKQLADELNLSFDELLQLSKSNTKYDKILDTKQVAMASGGNSVIGSRLAIWLMKEKAFTVYLNASQETRVKRIMAREGDSYNKTLKYTNNRDLQDAERFKKLYGININNYSFADLIIDVDLLSITEIVDIIITKFNEYNFVNKLREGLKSS